MQALRYKYIMIDRILCRPTGSQVLKQLYVQLWLHNHRVALIIYVVHIIVTMKLQRNVDKCVLGMFHSVKFTLLIIRMCI